MTKAEREQIIKEIIENLRILGIISETDEKRAEKIERENNDPITRAAKEQKCKALIAKWEAWGIL